MTEPLYDEHVESHCFLAAALGEDCSWVTKNRLWSRVGRLQVYCLQLPALIVLNRETEDDGELRLMSQQGENLAP